MLYNPYKECTTTAEAQTIAENIGKSDYKNWVLGLTFDQLLKEHKMTATFAQQNGVTKKDLIQLMLY